jgi:hypothetical protein
MIREYLPQLRVHLTVVRSPSPSLSLCPRRNRSPKRHTLRPMSGLLTGSEMAARELNANECKQRLQAREQLAIDLTLGPCAPLPTAAEMPRFGHRDVAVITGQQDEILVIRATHPNPETVVVRATPSSTMDISTITKKEKNPCILSASTAPALLKTKSRPKLRSSTYFGLQGNV